MAIIYCIENLENRMRYIGQTQDFKKRIREHKYRLRNKIHPNSHLQSAWELYGEQNFIFYILEECGIEELDEKEMFYIRKLNTIEEGYNQVEGGGGIRGWKHSEEFKERMRQSNIENPRIPSKEQIEALIFYNKTRNYRHSEETKEKMRIAHRGKKASEETKKKCSEAQLKVWKGNEARKKKFSDRMKGAKNIYFSLTEEQKREAVKKIKKANTGKKRSKETCKNIGNIHRGTKYMTNGKENIRVHEGDFEKYLNSGYKFGRTKYWVKKNSNNYRGENELS